jgi:hypothetical protein
MTHVLYPSQWLFMMVLPTHRALRHNCLLRHHAVHYAGHVCGAVTRPPDSVTRRAVIRACTTRQKSTHALCTLGTSQPLVLNAGGDVASSQRFVTHADGPRGGFGPLPEWRVGAKSACWLEDLAHVAV